MEHKVLFFYLAETKNTIKWLIFLLTDYLHIFYANQTAFHLHYIHA